MLEASDTVALTALPEEAMGVVMVFRDAVNGTRYVYNADSHHLE